LRILVADDELGVRDVLRRYLEADGHSVETASNGEDALACYKCGKWDLVLTDRVMPRMSGDELAEAIKEIDAGMPIILVTAYADWAPAAFSTRSPYDLLVRKPFNREIIQAAVRAISAGLVHR